MRAVVCGRAVLVLRPVAGAGSAGIFVSMIAAEAMPSWWDAADTTDSWWTWPSRNSPASDSPEDASNARTETSPTSRDRVDGRTRNMVATMTWAVAGSNWVCECLSRS